MTTAGCWRWSPSLKRNERGGRHTVILPVDRRQILRFSDLSIQAVFSKSSMILCSRSALEGSALSTSSWTVCDSVQTPEITKGTGTASVQTTVVAGDLVLGDAIHAASPAQMLLVRSGDQVYLIFDGVRALIDPTDPVIVNALHLQNAQVRPISPGVLNAFPLVAPIRPIAIEGAGEPIPLFPAYPVGAFSYSSGIEWAVEAGDIKDAETLRQWLAAMLGALPMLLGSGTGSELRAPLGITIIGGLLISQVLTLFTTPVVYLFFDRIGRKYLGTAKIDEEFYEHTHGGKHPPDHGGGSLPEPLPGD